MKSRLLFALLLLSLLSCTSRTENRRYIGAWRATTDRGEVVTWHFTENMLEVRVKDQSFSSEYKLDTTKEPAWIDFKTKDESVRAIIEFTSRTSFRALGVDRDDKPRPSTFDDGKEVLRFERIPD